MRSYLAHADDAGYWYPFHDLRIPVRVLDVADTDGSRQLSIRVTAQRAGHGYEYPVGYEVIVHAASVRPKDLPTSAMNDGWNWCDGTDHHRACPQCGDVHRVRRGVSGRVMGGIWVRGAEITECRRCQRGVSYVAK